MGACATKPMAQGEAPPPMEPDPQAEDGGGGREVEQGPAPAPDDNRRRSLGELFKQNEEMIRSSETDKSVVSETVTPEPVEVKEEVIENKAIDEAVLHKADKQPTEVPKAEAEAADEAISNSTPQETSVPPPALDSEVITADVEPLGSEVKAQVETGKVETVESSPTEGGPAASEKKDV